MLVNLACDWGRPSRNWPCAWTPSDFYRFLLSVSRNRFLSTDLQSAFFGSASEKIRPADSRFIAQTHTLCSTTKGGLSQRLDFTSTRIQAAKYRHSYLTDGLGNKAGGMLRIAGATGFVE